MKFQPNDHQAFKGIADEIKNFEGIEHKNLVRYYGVEVHKVRTWVYHISLWYVVFCDFLYIGGLVVLISWSPTFKIFTCSFIAMYFSGLDCFLQKQTKNSSKHGLEWYELNLTVCREGFQIVGCVEKKYRLQTKNRYSTLKWWVEFDNHIDMKHILFIGKKC